MEHKNKVELTRKHLLLILPSWLGCLAKYSCITHICLPFIYFQVSFKTFYFLIKGRVFQMYLGPNSLLYQALHNKIVSL
jgi:hypothetical protein